VQRLAPPVIVKLPSGASTLASRVDRVAIEFGSRDDAAALPSVIDLRGTGVRSRVFEDDGTREVLLPPDFESLTLSPTATSRWKVRDDDNGAFLDLTLRSARGDGVARVEGLGGVPTLAVTDIEDLDLRALTAHFRPRALELRGAPDVLRGSDALAALADLESLECWRCLDVDAAQMPALTAWPTLRKARVVEVLDTEAALLKRH
jgi:hypothetical protein